MENITIAIDGYSACGKSTTAKAVAAVLGYSYVDTGAMYRAVTLYFHQNYINITNTKAIDKALTEISILFKYNPKTYQNETFLNNLNVEEEIRKMYISDLVSSVSAIPSVRKFLTQQQQKMGKKGGLVMDGRDIGTTVFPNAELKIFVIADETVRANRRQQELLERGELISFDTILHNLKTRDQIDSSRKESPLQKAIDANILDTSYISIEEQVEIVLRWATRKMIKKHQLSNV